MVADKQKVSNTGIGLSAGIEKRKGKTRLQGYYGAEAFLWIGSSTTKNTYANAMSDSTGMATSTTQFATGGTGTTGTTYAGSPTSTRITQIKNGTNFQFGVRGFVGVEYFILPKISLGGEFGWGIGISTTGAGQTTTEASYVKPNAPTATSYASSTNTVKNPGNSSAFVVGTDNKNSIFGPSGSLRLNFYF
jgi:hypothetical protein